MDYIMELLERILPIIIELIVTVVIPLIFTKISLKAKNDTQMKLIEEAKQLALNCVCTMEQTMVQPLKENGEWDAEMAARAFELCKKQLLDNLSDAAVAAIQTVCKDLEIWCANEIESNVLYLHQQ